MMIKIWSIIRQFLKNIFEKIQNEKIKRNLLLAIPFWVGSLITGVFAVLYAKIFEYGEELLYIILAWKKWSIFILTPLSFIVSWWLVKRFASYARGSGIPQVMAAVELANHKEKRKINRFLSLKILIIKVISSTILVIGGGAIGREGPTIQIAGSIFRKVHAILPHWWPRISQRNMIMTSAAAGLSAAFNTPLGGIVFTIEQLSKTHINYFKTALFTAVIIAGLTAQSFARPYLYLGYPKTNGITIMIIFPVILVSAVCGIAASYLSKSMIAISQWKNKLKSNRSQIAFLLVISLSLASIAFFINIEVLGSGDEVMSRVLFTDDKSNEWYIPILRMIGPALSFSSGGAGGIFAPALASGASFGSVIGSFLELQPNEINVVALAGMVAFLTGVTRTPFTSTILVLEMTDRHSLIFYLMLAGMISSIFSLMVGRHSFYDIQKVNYLKDVRDKNTKKSDK